MALTDKELPSITEGVLYVIIFVIIMPLCIFSLAFICWNLSRTRRNKLFKTSPLNRLNELGFRDDLKHEHTKWYFTETIKSGYISNCSIHVDFNAKNLKRIAFTTSVEFQKIDVHRFERLEKHDISVDFLKASKNYTLKDLKQMSIHTLKNDLEQFIRVLIHEGYIKMI